MVKQYHYIAIKINNMQSYAVIRELITGECHLYSIVEKLRQKMTIKAFSLGCAIRTSTLTVISYRKDNT